MDEHINRILKLLRQANGTQAAAAYSQSFDHLPPRTRLWLESLLGLYVLSGMTDLLRNEFADSTFNKDADNAIKALETYCQHGDIQTVKKLLKKFSHKSAYRDFRLLLSAMIAIENTEDCLGKLNLIPESSPYYRIAWLVRSAVTGSNQPTTSRKLDADEHRFVQTLCAEHNIPAQAAIHTESNPRQLFEWLIENIEKFEPENLKVLLINLLTDYPAGMDAYQSRFGKLTKLESSRIQALASECSNNWSSAIQHWTDCLQTDELQHLDDSETARQLILQRINLCQDESGYDNQLLKQRVSQNPNDVDTCLQLLEHYRSTEENQAFKQLLTQAITRFPQNPDIVVAAVEHATEAIEFEQATRLAQGLLDDDSLNQDKRRLLIQAHLGYADKLALRGQSHAALSLLDQIEVLEKPSPSGIACLHRALVCYVSGDETRAQQFVEQGCTQLDSYLKGYLIMAAEMSRFGFKTKYKKQYLKLMQSLVNYHPDAEEMVSLIRLLHDYSSDSRINSNDLITSLRPFLFRSLNSDFKTEQWINLCKTLEQMNLYEDLQQVALTACQKAETSHIDEFEYYRIIGATKGNPAHITTEDSMLLEQMLDQLDQTNPALQSRITAFLSSNLVANPNNSEALPVHGILSVLGHQPTIKPDELLTTIKRLFNRSPG